MKTQNNKLNFKGETIYGGIDVHQKSWKVTLRSSNMELKTFTQPPDPKIFIRYLYREYPGANYLCCYESGFSGFWIHDQLQSKNISCSVVHPADVPTTDKERNQKSDKRDSRKLARSLENGEIKSIYIHKNNNLEARSLIRCWKTLGWDLTRSKNRIKSLLAFYGVSYPQKFADNSKHWSNRFIKWLESIKMETEAGNFTLSSHIKQMINTRQVRSETIKKIRQVSSTELYKVKVDCLISVPGIGILSAMLFLTEIGDIKHFKNFDKLCSYIGLIPTTYSSGDTKCIGKMTKRGNGWVKEMLIECSWMAIRKDPALLAKYKQLCKKMDQNKAIIHIARKLLNRIRFVLLNEQKYEFKKVK